jgi:hypothetical protein
MHAVQARAQPDALARGKLVPLAEHRGDFLPAEAREKLGLRAGRLDDHDFGFEAVGRDLGWS